MNEFLTENIRRAYPLKYRIPVPQGADETTALAYDILGRILVDASISCGARLPDEDTTDVIRLIRAYRPQGAGVLSVRIGTSDEAAESIGVNIRITDANRFSTVYASSSGFKVFLTINNEALSELFSTAAYGTWNIDVPFASRCVDAAVPVVDSIAVYSPKQDDMCKHVVFSPAEVPVKTIVGGDVTIAAGDGLDLETVHMEPIKGDMLRISAITAPAETTESSNAKAIMIRGDDCIEVENIPGVTADDDGLIYRLEDPSAGGVIRIRQLCKACCQCDDYRDAFHSLDPANDAAAVLEKLLDEIRDDYETAVTAFNTLKEQAKEAVNGYDHVYVNATSVTSRPIYAESTASGKRRRVAINLMVVNMTRTTLAVRNDPMITLTTATEEPEYTLQSKHWNVSGTYATAGTDFPDNDWYLAPGCVLIISYTYAQQGTANRGEKPQAKATVRLKLGTETGEYEPREVDVV